MGYRSTGGVDKSTSLTAVGVDASFSSSCAETADESVSLMDDSVRSCGALDNGCDFHYGSLGRDDSFIPFLTTNHDDDGENDDCHGDFARRKGATHDETEAGQSSVKSIGTLGSIAIAVNSLAGPAILQLPFQYQESGIIPTTVCLIAVGILSSYCCLHMANTVSQVPGNRNFDQCIEFSDPFRIFWNHKAYVVTQILFFLCTTCLNIAAMVDTAEVVDSFLGYHYKSGGWNAQPQNGGGMLEWQTWSHTPCNRHDVKKGVCEPFGDESIYGDYLLTVGYIITAAVFIPICLMDLKENTAWQIFGFSLLVTISSYFCIAFSGYKLSFHHVSLWGHQWSDMMGVILFNFSLVMAIPAWLNEKKATVSVEKVVYGSTAISTILYIAVGILGAFAIPHVNVNLLEPMVSGAYGVGLQLSGSLFAFFIIGLDIPLFSVLCRYNLTHSGLCSKRTANMLVVWLPWLGSWIFYQGDAIGKLLDWGGVLLTSAIAFLLPLYIALRALVTTNQEGSILVYGRVVNRKRQIFLLYILLFIAAVAVILAIVGQVATQELRAEQQRQAILESANFNGTSLADDEVFQPKRVIHGSTRTKSLK